MPHFFCNHCTQEIKSLLHVCGRNDPIGGEVTTGGSWGRIIGEKESYNN